MARKKLGELTEDDISAGAARAQRLCQQVPEDCRSACRAGVMETERQLKEHPTVIRKRPIVMDGIKLCMSEYKDEASRFACSNGVRFGVSARKGRKRRA
jgi:hypothetical protein